LEGGVGVAVRLVESARPQKVSAEGVTKADGGDGVLNVGVAIVSNDFGVQAAGGVVWSEGKAAAISSEKGLEVPLVCWGVTMPDDRLVGGDCGLSGGDVSDR